MPMELIIWICGEAISILKGIYKFVEQFILPLSCTFAGKTMLNHFLHLLLQLAAVHLSSSLLLSRRQIVVYPHVLQLRPFAVFFELFESPEDF